MSRHPGKLLNRLLAESALTLVAEGIVLVMFFVFYRMLLNLHGTENLGLYALIRRILAVLLPLLLLGVSEGLGRYVANYRDPNARATMIGAGALVTALTNGLMLGLLNAWPEQSAKWLFGDRSYAYMVVPFSLTMAGLSMHQFAHACLRGMLRVVPFNALQVLNLAVMPVLILLWPGAGDFARAVSMIGACQFAVAFLFLLPATWGLRRAGTTRAARGLLREVFVFSIGRIPGVMVGTGLASLGPILATRHLSMTEIGYLSLSLSLLIGVGGLIAPVGSVLLPRLSALAAGDQIEAIERRLPLLIGASLHVFLFLTMLYLVFADCFIEIWMGPAFIPAARISAIVMASLVFFGFYFATRSVLDAASTRPINSVNTLVALGVLCALSTAAVYVGTRDNLGELFAWAFSGSAAVLGALTYVSLRMMFPHHRAEDLHQLVRGVLAVAIVVIPGLLFKSALTCHAGLLSVYSACAFGLYLLILARLGCEWVPLLWHTALRQWQGLSKRQ